MLRSVASVIVVLTLAALPARAVADEPPTVAARGTFTEAQILEAEDRFREGHALYENGRIDEARLKYAQAFAVLDRTTILWNLAVSEFHSDKPVEAYRHFQEFVRRPDADAEDVQRAREKYLVAGAAQVGRIYVEAPAGTALVLDDDLQLGAAPFSDAFAVRPGEHRLHTHLGDREETKTVVVAAGEIATVRVAAPLPVAAPSTNSAPVAGSADRHRARTVTTLSLGAGALVGLSVGIAFGLDSQSKKDGNDAYRATQPEGFCVDPASAPCVEWNQRLKNQRTSATVSTIGYASAGVLAASALAAWVFWPKPRTKAAPGSAWAAPVWTEATVGVTVGGEF